MLNAERLNAYRLKKQNIWVKSEDYLSVLKSQIALHSTDQLTPFISLWARVKNFDAKAFYHDMLISKEAARVRAFRGTLFIIHKDWIGYIMPALDEFLAQRKKESLRYADRLGIDPELVRLILEKMQGGKSLSSRELKQVLDGEIKGDALTVMIRYLEYSCKITRANGRNPLDSVVKYGRWEDILPQNYGVEKKSGLEKVLLQYIGQFGPVSINDIAWWFPLTKTATKKALEYIGNKLEKLAIDEKGYFMTKADFQDFQSFSSNDKSDHISFLPYEDHFTKAYIDREWFLPPGALELVTEKSVMMQGQILPSIWLNDQIIGRWQLCWQDSKKSRATVRVDKILEEKSDQNILNKIKDKRNELEAFLNEQMVPLVKK